MLSIHQIEKEKVPGKKNVLGHHYIRAVGIRGGPGELLYSHPGQTSPDFNNC
jgi:hypothetical protein